MKEKTKKEEKEEEEGEEEEEEEEEEEGRRRWWWRRTLGCEQSNTPWARRGHGCSPRKGFLWVEVWKAKWEKQVQGGGWWWGGAGVEGWSEGGASWIFDLDDASVDFVSVMVDICDALQALENAQDLFVHIKKEKIIELIKQALKHGQQEDLLTSLAEAMVQSQCWKEKYDQCLSSLAQAVIHESRWRTAEEVRSALSANVDGSEVAEAIQDVAFLSEQLPGIERWVADWRRDVHHYVAAAVNMFRRGCWGGTAMTLQNLVMELSMCWPDNAELQAIEMQMGSRDGVSWWPGLKPTIFWRGRPWPEGSKNIVQKKFALIFWPLVLADSEFRVCTHQGGHAPTRFLEWFLEGSLTLTWQSVFIEVA